jgi:hypothetical protein
MLTSWPVGLPTKFVIWYPCYAPCFLSSNAHDQAKNNVWQKDSSPCIEPRPSFCEGRLKSSTTMKNGFCFMVQMSSWSANLYENSPFSFGLCNVLGSCTTNNNYVYKEPSKMPLSSCKDSWYMLNDTQAQ